MALVTLGTGATSESGRPGTRHARLRAGIFADFGTAGYRAWPWPRSILPALVNWDDPARGTLVQEVLSKEETTRIRNSVTEVRNRGPKLAATLLSKNTIHRSGNRRFPFGIFQKRRLVRGFTSRNTNKKQDDSRELSIALVIHLNYPNKCAVKLCT